MDISIKAIHFDITEKLESFITKKVERLTRRYASIATVDVILKVVKPETSLNKEVTVKITAPQMEDMVAVKTTDTFEEAVDNCLDALERQLEKAKNKK